MIKPEIFNMVEPSLMEGYITENLVDSKKTY
jgi:hypothetical protein